jgi:general secretion pathway protein C
MARYVSWVVNAALLALGCFLVAQSANTVLAALLTPSPVGENAAPAAPPPPGRTWSDREVILTRNLFNASLLTPEPAHSPEEEVLEATALPLTLLGTAASDRPELSWAAIEDRESQRTLVLRVDDVVRSQAKVVRIERRRIVLSENGALRELALEEPEATGVGPAAATAAAAASRRLARAARRAVHPQPERPQAPGPSPPAEAARSPTQLFSEARILPKYQEGQMVGVQVSAIKPGSLFEEMGIQDGDVITELNGIRIDSPEQSAKVLLELTKSEAFTLQVEGPSGPRTLNVDLPEP